MGHGPGRVKTLMGVRLRRRGRPCNRAPPLFFRQLHPHPSTPNMWSTANHNNTYCATLPKLTVKITRLVHLSVGQGSVAVGICDVVHEQLGALKAVVDVHEAER